MFEKFGKNNESPLLIDAETFKDVYESNLDSAFADNIHTIAQYLSEGEIAAQMTQKGAEFDQEYLEQLRAIRKYLESINFTATDLGHVESLALNLIKEESKKDLSESFQTYLTMVQAGNSKLNEIN